MKVLIATTYIFKKEWPEFTRNQTGFGFMVNDIFESVSEETDTYLISQVITKGHGKVLKHTWGDVFGNATIKDWGKAFKYFFGYPQGIKGRVKYFYYALNSGSIRKTIRSLQPDVVHIQGISAQVKPFIDVCEEEQIPYIVTLHGLIGLDDTVRAASWDKKMEREFLVEAEKKGIPVTVISTGMKLRIEKNYLGHKASNITVVCNGTRIPYDEKLVGLESLDIRKEFGLKQDEKIIVSIGTVCERKNQIQIIRAMRQVKVPCHVFLCGADASNGTVQDAVKDFGLESRIHMLGFLPTEKVEQVLEQADLNVLASKDEGFGLSIIDAYSHGVPIVSFADLDAVANLYEERAMVKVESRVDDDLAAGINEGLKKQWDKAWIKKYAKSFSLEKLAEQYEQEYRQILSGGGNMSIAKTCDYLAVQKRHGYKILVYIGNITDNKNQIELVKLMPELDGYIAVLAGREVDDGMVRQQVIDVGLEERVVLVGFCSEMDSIWINADLNVFLSKNDGFGLSIIEGYMRGVPSVMFDDLDAVEDVKGPGLYLLNRDSDFLKKTILQSTTHRDKRGIIHNSLKHSMKNMCTEYVKYYNEIVSRVIE